MIVQFGTSRFLQAHVDLFASEARDAGQDVPRITIVQVTDDADRARRLPAFADPAGFPVKIRGVRDGEGVDRQVMVRSVHEGLSLTGGDWPRLRDLFVTRATHVVSNTGDTGLRLTDAVYADAGAEPPRTFLGALTRLLHARWLANAGPVSIFPCELVSRNGDTLRDAISAVGRRWSLDDAFSVWLTDACRWANTLVDRIVSAPIEPAGAVAEPYALWAIEKQPGLALPFDHAAIRWVDSIDDVERLKVHILNLGHSWLAERWADMDSDPAATVRGMLSDPATRHALDRVYADEVVRGFAAIGMGPAAAAFVETTLERFANPFLDHRVADIHVAHREKIAKRVGGFIDWIDRTAVSVPMPELRAWARRNGQERP